MMAGRSAGRALPARGAREEEGEAAGSEKRSMDGEIVFVERRFLEDFFLNLQGRAPRGVPFGSRLSGGRGRRKALELPDLALCQRANYRLMDHGRRGETCSGDGVEFLKAPGHPLDVRFRDVAGRAFTHLGRGALDHLEGGNQRLALLPRKTLESLGQLKDLPRDPLAVLRALLPVPAREDPLDRGVTDAGQLQEPLHLGKDTVLVLVDGRLGRPPQGRPLTTLEALL